MVDLSISPDIVILAATVWYIFNTWLKSKEVRERLEKYGFTDEIPEPFRTLFSWMQTNDSMRSGALMERVHRLEQQMIEITDLCKNIYANCADCRADVLQEIVSLKTGPKFHDSTQEILDTLE